MQDFAHIPDNLGDSNLSPLELLDQLCTALLECVFVASAVQERDLVDIDPLAKNLTEMLHFTSWAYRAASLLEQGAELGHNGGGRLKPQHVLDSHVAAVKRGAVQVAAQEPRVSPLLTSLRDASLGIDSTENQPHPAPRCATRIKSKRQYKGRVAYLGDGTYAAHCREHLSLAEQHAWVTHQIAVEEAGQQVIDHQARLLKRTAEMVISEWQQVRAFRTPCVESAGAAHH